MWNPLKIVKLPTGDGSTTLLHEGLNETYHSRHGALRESMHVYILRGFLDACCEAGVVNREGMEGGWKGERRRNVRVFEMGFGTGLNAWLLREVSEGIGVSVEYRGIEKFSLDARHYGDLDFDFNSVATHWSLVVGNNWPGLFRDGWINHYRRRWLDLVEKGNASQLDSMDLGVWRKVEGDVLTDLEVVMEDQTDVVFWDAFAPKKQPELWSVELFNRVRNKMVSGGVLVTYTANGQVRRNLLSAGYRVEKIGGPPGKREMLRAWK